MSYAEKEEIVFEFWNSYKGSEALTKTDPKTKNLIRWHSHNKLTHDIRTAIREGLKNYSLEEICGAINNYATVLLEDKYFWTHVWPLSTFLTVKYEKGKDAPQKWWQFLPENFVEQNYLKWGKERGSEREQENIVEDPDPELTNLILTSLRKWKICSKNFSPNPKQVDQIRLTSKKMLKFYKDRKCRKKEVWLEDLYDCLEKNYLSKGENISVGFFCSDYLWDILMPQLLRGCGGV